jgi:GNAT superfamily N-acetyltransferase/RimJ/RimL family protein N-acetyltransferase
VRLREWDPAAAPEEDLQSWLRAYNCALAADLPDDPVWGDSRLRDYLTVTMPGERRLTWLAEDPSTNEVLGYGRLLMLNDLGVLELYVVPQARRQGVGRALLTTMARRALNEGFTSLGVEVIGDTSAVDFYRRHGFSHAYTEMRSILDLSTVDWPHLSEMADGIAHGYRIEYHPLDLPPEMLTGYAEAKQVRKFDPTGDLSLRPSSYDEERLRASLECLRERGLKPYIVVAVHERTERVAGLTELVVPAQHPTRADQYDTIIVPEHNGYGLARAIKARMLLELRAAEPALRDVQTWHAPEREQLQQVNKELGFKPDREWREYEVQADELAKRLASA